MAEEIPIGLILTAKEGFNYSWDIHFGGIYIGTVYGDDVDQAKLNAAYAFAEWIQDQ